ncbi:MAG: hypothetical protein LBW85_10600 [Deltaproteobacteria bacterium]|jgi:hypothetical protein|nr:hypothetical protein [Deltaproteobacteria bacterium]
MRNIIIANRGGKRAALTLAAAAVAAAAALAMYSAPARADGVTGGGFSLETPDGAFSIGLNFGETYDAGSGGDTYISNTYVNETTVARAGNRGGRPPAHAGPPDRPRPGGPGIGKPGPGKPGIDRPRHVRPGKVPNTCPSSWHKKPPSKVGCLRDNSRR